MSAHRGGSAVEVSCPELLRESVNLFPESDDEFGLCGELDWSLKYQLLSHVSAGEKDFGGARARRAELAFHDLSRQYGLRERLLKSGSVKPLVDENCITRAKSVPPANTRALLRGKVVEACDLAGRSASIGWSYVRLDDPPSPQIDLLNPLENESAEISQLLAKIENLKRG